MAENQIVPDKITKPIQLLGAWLAGLLAIDSCFLIAAARMDQGSWESAALTVAAILNVPLFLAAVFLLQTKFRPELQEDVYYSTYISQKTNVKVQVSREEAGINQLAQRLERLEHTISTSIGATAKSVTNELLAKVKFGINKNFKNKASVAKMLAEAGVLGYTLFGSEETPKKWVVSISIHLPDEFVPAIVDLARRAGFRHYNFFDNAFENAGEDVLFGSYGPGEFEIAADEIS